MFGYIKTQEPQVDLDKGVVLPTKEKEPPIGVGEIVALLCCAAVVIAVIAARFWAFFPLVAS